MTTQRVLIVGGGCVGLFPAWFMHRTYHLSRVPTMNRKVRVTGDWTLALFFRRELVSLGALQCSREEFDLATGKRNE